MDCRESFFFLQGVSAKTFEPNNSVIFVKFKMQIFNVKSIKIYIKN
jgi:hypothetical protein